MFNNGAPGSGIDSSGFESDLAVGGQILIILVTSFSRTTMIQASFHFTKRCTG